MGDKREPTTLVSFRLRAEDLDRLDKLVAAGYGANRTEVLRRSVKETAIWTLPRKGKG